MNPSKSETDSIASHWGLKALPEEESARGAVCWMNHQWVERQYINRAFSPAPHENWLTYTHRKYFPNPVALAASFGCGSGGLERHALSLPIARAFEAFDISPGALEVAREHLQRLGLGDKVSYALADLNTHEFKRNVYDAAFASMSVHHVADLKHFFASACASMKEGALFVLNEFIGPTQFQWTDKQLWIANLLLDCLPESLRKSCAPPFDEVKRVRRNQLQEMDDIDASEAVRSSDLVATAVNYFDVVERIDYGGTLLLPAAG